MSSGGDADKREVRRREGDEFSVSNNLVVFNPPVELRRVKFVSSDDEYNNNRGSPTSLSSSSDSNESEDARPGRLLKSVRLSVNVKHENEKNVEKTIAGVSGIIKNYYFVARLRDGRCVYRLFGQNPFGFIASNIHKNLSASAFDFHRLTFIVGSSENTACSSSAGSSGGILATNTNEVSDSESD